MTEVEPSVLKLLLQGHSADGRFKVKPLPAARFRKGYAQVNPQIEDRGFLRLWTKT
jgi:hypothetical protein